MQLRSSFQSLFILRDRIEKISPAFYGARAEAISYEDVIGVDVERGRLFATMRIESRDGRTIEVGGLNGRKAEEARKLLNRLTVVAQQRSYPVAPRQSDTEAEIEKLAALRDDGFLTPEEFEAQRNQLLEP